MPTNKIRAKVLAQQSVTKTNYLSRGSFLSALEGKSRQLFTPDENNLKRTRATNYLRGDEQTKYALEIIVSPEDATLLQSVSDKPDEQYEKAVQVSRRAMRQILGQIDADNARWVGVLHRNTAHPHLHILVGESYTTEENELKQLKRIPRFLLVKDENGQSELERRFSKALRANLAIDPPSIETFVPDGSVLPELNANYETEAVVGLTEKAAFSLKSLQRARENGTLAATTDAEAVFIRRNAEGHATGATWTEAAAAETSTWKRTGFENGGWFYIGDLRRATSYIFVSSPEEALALETLHTGRNLENAVIIALEPRRLDAELADLLINRQRALANEDKELNLIWATNSTRGGRQHSFGQVELKAYADKILKDENLPGLNFIPYSRNTSWIEHLNLVTNVAELTSIVETGTQLQPIARVEIPQDIQFTPTLASLPRAVKTEEVETPEAIASVVETPNSLLPDEKVRQNPPPLSETPQNRQSSLTPLEVFKEMTSQARQVPLEAIASAHGLCETVFKGERVWIDDTRRIKITNELFSDRSNGMRGGRGSIDFVAYLQDLPQESAFRTARQWIVDNGFLKNHVAENPQILKPAITKNLLAMPPEITDNLETVRFYLEEKRKINYETVQKLIANKTLYANEFSSAVFVHRDLDGHTTGATWRDTTEGSTLRGNATGTDKEAGYFYLGSPKRATRIILTEAPIDAISYYELETANGVDLSETAIISIGGSSTPQSLVEFISHRQIQLETQNSDKILDIIFATDNDRAGELAFDKFIEKLRQIAPDIINEEEETAKILLTRQVPENGKDWNDSLKIQADAPRYATLDEIKEIQIESLKDPTERTPSAKLTRNFPQNLENETNLINNEENTDEPINDTPNDDEPTERTENEFPAERVDAAGNGLYGRTDSASLPGRTSRRDDSSDVPILEQPSRSDLSEAAGLEPERFAGAGNGARRFDADSRTDGLGRNGRQQFEDVDVDTDVVTEVENVFSNDSESASLAPAVIPLREEKIYRFKLRNDGSGQFLEYRVGLNQDNLWQTFARAIVGTKDQEQKKVHYARLDADGENTARLESLKEAVAEIDASLRKLDTNRNEFSPLYQDIYRFHQDFLENLAPPPVRVEVPGEIIPSNIKKIYKNEQGFKIVFNDRRFTRSFAFRRDDGSILDSDAVREEAGLWRELCESRGDKVGDDAEYKIFEPETLYDDETGNRVRANVVFDEIDNLWRGSLSANIRAAGQQLVVTAKPVNLLHRGFETRDALLANLSVKAIGKIEKRLDYINSKEAKKMFQTVVSALELKGQFYLGIEAAEQVTEELRRNNEPEQIQSDAGAADYQRESQELFEKPRIKSDQNPTFNQLETGEIIAANVRRPLTTLDLEAADGVAGLEEILPSVKNFIKSGDTDLKLWFADPLDNAARGALEARQIALTDLPAEDGQILVVAKAENSFALNKEFDLPTLRRINLEATRYAETVQFDRSTEAVAIQKIRGEIFYAACLKQTSEQLYQNSFALLEENEQMTVLGEVEHSLRDFGFDSISNVAKDDNNRAVRHLIAFEDTWTVVGGNHAPAILKPAEQSLERELTPESREEVSLNLEEKSFRLSEDSRFALGELPTALNVFRYTLGEKADVQSKTVYLIATEQELEAIRNHIREEFQIKLEFSEINDPRELAYTQNLGKKAFDLSKDEYIAKRRWESVLRVERQINDLQNEIADLQNLDKLSFRQKKQLAENETLLNHSFRVLAGDKLFEDKTNLKTYTQEYQLAVARAIKKGLVAPERRTELAQQDGAFRNAAGNRMRYEKGRTTAFANRSQALDDSMRERLGYKVKRQDGKEISQTQKSEIEMGVKELEKVFGSLKDVFRKGDITFVHTSGKHPFLMNAGGAYNASERTINFGVENRITGDPVRALAHEFAHYLDNEAGTRDLRETDARPKARMSSSKQLVELKFLSENDNPSFFSASSDGDLIKDARRLLRESVPTSTGRLYSEESIKMRAGEMSALTTDEQAAVERGKIVLGPYWKEPSEIFARLVEQYVSVKLEKEVRFSAEKDYSDKIGYWSREDFETLTPRLEAEINRRFALVGDAFDIELPRIAEEIEKVEKVEEIEEIEIETLPQVLPQTANQSISKESQKLLDRIAELVKNEPQTTAAAIRAEINFDSDSPAINIYANKDDKMYSVYAPDAENPNYLVVAHEYSPGSFGEAPDWVETHSQEFSSLETAIERIGKNETFDESKFKSDLVSAFQTTLKDETAIFFDYDLNPERGQARIAFQVEVGMLAEKMRERDFRYKYITDKTANEVFFTLEAEKQKEFDEAEKQKLIAESVADENQNRFDFEKVRDAKTATAPNAADEIKNEIKAASKLLPDSLLNKMAERQENESSRDNHVYAKLFHPMSSWTMFITEAEAVNDENGKLEDVHLYGYVHTDGIGDEWGTSSLREIESTVVRGLKTERDKYFTEGRFSDVYRQFADERGLIVPDEFLDAPAATTAELELIIGTDNEADSSAEKLETLELMPDPEMRGFYDSSADWQLRMTSGTIEKITVAGAPVHDYEFSPTEKSNAKFYSITVSDADGKLFKFNLEATAERIAKFRETRLKVGDTVSAYGYVNTVIEAKRAEQPEVEKLKTIPVNAVEMRWRSNEIAQPIETPATDSSHEQAETVSDAERRSFVEQDLRSIARLSPNAEIFRTKVADKVVDSIIVNAEEGTKYAALTAEIIDTNSETGADEAALLYERFFDQANESDSRFLGASETDNGVINSELETRKRELVRADTEGVYEYENEIDFGGYVQDEEEVALAATVQGLIQLNEKERAVFQAAAQQIVDSTGGQFGYLSEADTPEGMSRQEFAGYCGSLAQKGLISVSDDEYKQLMLTPTGADALRQRGIFNDKNFELTTGEWSEAIAPSKSYNDGERSEILSPAEPELAPEAVKPQLTQYRITDAAIHDTGLKTKFKDNVKAINLLRQIEDESRLATGEEQQVLAKFSGWGGLKSAFDIYNQNADWKKEIEETQKLFSDSTEYWNVRQSTENAHYTSVKVSEKMWRVAQELGFSGGRVLEPAVGVGNLVGTMPDELRQTTKVTAVEKESYSARIAGQLYQRSNVVNSGFEEARLKDDSFNLVISNFPFGSFSVHDPQYNALKPSIHDYFFLKSLDKVAEGGLVIALTSRYTLDKEDTKIREAIARRADLVGAIRLPDTAFKANAHTEVVTDMLIFQKRPKGQERGETEINNLSWIKSEYLDLDDGTRQKVNNYFHEYPDKILGRTSSEGKMYGAESLTVKVETESEFFEKFDAGVADFKLAFASASPRQDNIVLERERGLVFDERAGRKNGNIIEVAGTLFQIDGDGETELSLSPREFEKTVGLINLRDTVKTIYLLEMDNVSADDERVLLNRQYDDFVKKHGILNRRENLKLLAGDPEVYLVKTLENYVNEKTGKAEKAEIFFQSTLQGYAKPESADDINHALAISLNETGKVNLERISDLLKTDNDTVIGQLKAESHAFLNPATQDWDIAEKYLSGNVREKLALAEETASISPENEILYAENVRALREIQPRDLDYMEIEPVIGASWIPKSDVNDFIIHLTKAEADTVRVENAPQTGQWSVSWTGNAESKRAKDRDTAVKIWGTERAAVMKIVQAALDGRPLHITDKITVGGKDVQVTNVAETEAANQKLMEVKQEFKDWIWSDPPRRARLHRDYNDKFNNLVERQYDGSRLTLPNSNPNVELRPHQKDAVWRAMQEPTVELAHEVGTGKTIAIGAALMEKKRLGQIRKPVLPCLKANIKQVTREIQNLYPTARIFSGDGAFEADSRKTDIAAVANNNWDMVILTYNQLDAIPLSKQTQSKYIRDEITVLEESIASALEADGKKSRIVSRLNIRSTALVNQLDKIIDKPKDEVLTFEETGIDFIAIDEAHSFKALPVYTTMNGIKGVPTSRSDRATNMHMRTEYLREKHGEGRLMMATGTPVTNTVAELYNIMRFTMPEELEKRQLHNFDSFAKNYTEIVTKLEASVTGEYKEQSRLAKFINVPELRSLAGITLDVVKADEAGVVRPKRADVVVSVPISEEQITYRAALKERAFDMKNVDPRDDNHLKLMNDGRLMSIDMRLVDEGAEDNPQSKTNYLVSNVLRIAEEKPGATQLIFSNLGIHESEKTGHSVFKDITRKLEEGGIPKERIANFATLSPKRRKEAIEKLNDGEILVALGSTDTLGTGVNAQKFIAAAHNLDVPWLPSAVEQRDGRVARFGNIFADINEDIEIYRYVTTGSFDELGWTTIDRKMSFINQIVSNDLKGNRQFEEPDAEEFSPAQISAIASGNPDVMKRIELADGIKRFESMEKRHRQTSLEIADEIPDKERWLESRQKHAADLETDYKIYRENRNQAGDKFKITLGGKDYDKISEVSGFLSAEMMTCTKKKTIGEFYGFDVVVDSRTGVGWNRTYPVIALESKVTQKGYDMKSDDSREIAENLSSSLAYLSRLAESSRVKNQKDAVELEALKEQSARPFRFAEDLERSRAELKEVEARLKDWREEQSRVLEVTKGVGVAILQEPESAKAERIKQELQQILETRTVIELPAFVSAEVTEARLRGVGVEEVRQLNSHRQTEEVFDDEVEIETDELQASLFLGDEKTEMEKPQMEKSLKVENGTPERSNPEAEISPASETGAPNKTGIYGKTEIPTRKANGYSNEPLFAGLVEDSPAPAGEISAIAEETFDVNKIARASSRDTLLVIPEESQKLLDRLGRLGKGKIGINLAAEAQAEQPKVKLAASDYAVLKAQIIVREAELADLKFDDALFDRDFAQKRFDVAREPADGGKEVSKTTTPKPVDRIEFLRLASTGEPLVSLQGNERDTEKWSLNDIRAAREVVAETRDFICEERNNREQNKWRNQQNLKSLYDSHFNPLKMAENHLRMFTPEGVENHFKAQVNPLAAIENHPIVQVVRSLREMKTAEAQAALLGKIQIELNQKLVTLDTGVTRQVIGKIEETRIAGRLAVSEKQKEIDELKELTKDAPDAVKPDFTSEELDKISASALRAGDRKLMFEYQNAVVENAKRLEADKLRFSEKYNTDAVDKFSARAMRELENTPVSEKQAVALVEKGGKYPRNMLDALHQIAEIKGEDYVRNLAGAHRVSGKTNFPQIETFDKIDVLAHADGQKLVADLRVKELESEFTRRFESKAGAGEPKVIRLDEETNVEWQDARQAETQIEAVKAGETVSETISQAQAQAQTAVENAKQMSDYLTRLSADFRVSLIKEGMNANVAPVINRSEAGLVNFDELKEKVQVYDKPAMTAETASLKQTEIHPGAQETLAQHTATDAARRELQERAVSASRAAAFEAETVDTSIMLGM
jgi:N12 class adenine-specific DNA methylase